MYLIGFLYLAGLAFYWAICLVGLCLVVSIVLARIRAETGTPWAFGLFGMARNTGESLVTAFGSQNFSPQGLTVVGITQWFYWDPRFFPLAHQIEALKIGDSVQLPRKRLAAILLIATFTGILMGFAACLTLSYHLGLNTAKVSEYTRTPDRFYLQLSDWLTNRTKPDVVGLPWIAGGALVTLMLVRARQAFLWWPFHPIGYVLAETGTANDFWFHYFLAWLLKSLILRYGGMKLYRTVLPLAVGVILGDIIAQTFWSALASLLGLPVYRFVA